MLLRLPRTWLPGWLLVALSPAVSGAEPTATERAAAETLFQDARQLSKQGKDAEACPKYEESNRIDPSIGTQLYLADCYEKIGKLASAWVLFKEAASQAQTAGQGAREKNAQARASALEPKLPRLTLQVAAADTPGLEVFQDGKPVRRSLWGSALPVDSGAHSLRATAPGRRPWELTVQARDGQAALVSVPELPPEGAAAPPASAPPPSAPASSSAPASTSAETRLAPPAGWSTQKTVGAVAAGAGVAGLAVGSYFAFQARSRWQDSRPECVNNLCSPRGYDLGKSAKSDGNLATVLLAVGAVGLGAGAFLWFTDKGPSGASVGVAPGALFVRGSWLNAPPSPASFSARRGLSPGRGLQRRLRHRRRRRRPQLGQGRRLRGRRLGGRRFSTRRLLRQRRPGGLGGRASRRRPGWLLR